MSDVSNRIKAVLFDYGNVLCLPQEPSDLDSMANCLQLEKHQLEPLYWRFRDDYDLGTSDGRLYWSKIAENASRELSDEQLTKLIELDSLSWSRPNHTMANWVRALSQSGVRTAIISNMPTELHQHIINRCDWLPTFDHYTFSCSIHVMKPDPEIFQHCLDALQLQAKDTLFLDDRELNIEGAKKVGIQSLLFKTAAELTEQVSAFGLPKIKN